MDRRSTNELAGFVHFGGDITAHVNSSHGVRLTGGSTGGIVEAVGDDTNVTLTLRAQGAAGVVIANSSQAARVVASSVYLNSTQVRIGSTASSVLVGNSTRFFRGIQGYTVQFTIPEMAASVTSDETYTGVTGLSTGSHVVVNPMGAALSTAYMLVGARCSTADELTVRWANNAASTIGSAGTTGRFAVLEFKY